MSIIDRLVTDRTEADVQRLEELNAKGWAAMTADERGEWRYGRAVPLLGADGQQLQDANGEPLECRDGVQRGDYTADDLNRVIAATRYVQTELRGHGIITELTQQQAAWTDEDTLPPDQMTTFLANLDRLRSALTLPDTAPAVPDNLDELAVGTANDLETILVLLDSSLAAMDTTYTPCGAECGGGNL